MSCGLGGGFCSTLVAWLAMTGCSRLDPNVPPFERYAKALIAQSGATLEPRGCAMFGGSRSGSCLLVGSAPERTKFATGLALRADKLAAQYGDQGCLARAGFGAPSGDVFNALPGVSRFVRGAASLPPNQENVVFVAAYEGPSAICVEFQYPYG